MKAKHIQFIIFLMSISLLGAGTVQWYWITHAIAEREKRFDHQVHEALREVVDKLEKQEAVFFIRDVTKNIPDVSDSVSTEVQKVVSMLGESANMDVEEEIHHTGQDTLKKVEVVIENDEGKKIILYQEGDHNIQLSKLSWQDTLKNEIKLIKESKQIKRKLTRYNKVLNQVIVERYTQDSPVHFRLMKADLPALLHESLDNRQIGLDFEYGVFNRNTRTFLADFSSPVVSEIPEGEWYRSDMFPNDLIEKRIDLKVIFPNKNRHMLGEVWWIMLISFLFSAIMLITFGSTLYFIFRQKRMAQMKTDFINNMTHEFKTPIATISLALDAMKHPKVQEDPGQLATYSGIIREENHRMNQQVEKVLQMAVMDKKELKLLPDRCALHELVQQAVNKMSLLLQSRDARLSLKLEASADGLVADAMHLQNVISNLLDNAIKYSSGVPEIEISTRNEGGGISLTVTDQGIGMSKDKLRKIFAPFFRITSGNRHDVKGFGLGLSYVQGIVSLHHGKLTVQSEPNKGSGFTIWLPIEKKYTSSGA